jgi:hypothetical protein
MPASQFSPFPFFVLLLVGFLGLVGFVFYVFAPFMLYGIFSRLGKNLDALRDVNFHLAALRAEFQRAQMAQHPSLPDVPASDPVKPPEFRSF